MKILIAVTLVVLGLLDTTIIRVFILCRGIWISNMKSPHYLNFYRGTEKCDFPIKNLVDDFNSDFEDEIADGMSNIRQQMQVSNQSNHNKF